MNVNMALDGFGRGSEFEHERPFFPYVPGLIIPAPAEHDPKSATAMHRDKILPEKARDSLVYNGYIEAEWESTLNLRLGSHRTRAEIIIAMSGEPRYLHVVSLNIRALDLLDSRSKKDARTARFLLQRQMHTPALVRRIAELP